jgi:hypothetical protein
MSGIRLASAAHSAPIACRTVLVAESNAGGGNTCLKILIMFSRSSSTISGYSHSTTSGKREGGIVRDISPLMVPCSGRGILSLKIRYRCAYSLLR